MHTNCMEEKTAYGNKNSLWSFFGIGNAFCSFFRKTNFGNSISIFVSSIITSKIAALLHCCIANNNETIEHLNKGKPQRGFTLIELLVTIAVIGAMAGAVTLVMNPVTQIQKANDAKRKSDLAQIQRALETFYNDFGRYPEADTSVATNYRIKKDSATTVGWGTNGFRPYMELLPIDPSSTKNYSYYSNSTTNNQSYYLFASLDRSNDPQACNNGSECTSISSGTIPGSPKCGTGNNCTYGVSSPNVSP